MRTTIFLLSALGLVLAACGQPAPSNADAQPSAAAPTQQSAGALTEADRTNMLRVIQVPIETDGQVTNDCNEKVTPQFIAVELGGVVGTAQLVIIPGGANSATCYGDGPGDIHLMRRLEGSSFSELYSLQGGMLAVLTTSHNGVRDLAYAGPGMSHAVSQWNGSAYVPHGEIADDAMGNAQIYPQ